MTKEKRWMLFVDGENFAIEGKKILDSANLSPEENRAYCWAGCFLWFPALDPTESHKWIPRITARDGKQLESILIANNAEKCRYYTTISGGDDRQPDLLRKVIWNSKFEPVVYKKREGNSKFVDIKLAVDAVSSYCQNKYDVAVLVAGDKDYCPLVEELKRLGADVCVAFWNGKERGLSPELKAEADVFVDLTPNLKKFWTSMKTSPALRT